MFPPDYLPYVSAPTSFWDSSFQQSGNGYLAGKRFQRGFGFGGFLSGLFRSALPILKSVGKSALKTGISVAGDVLEGEKVDSSLKRRGRTAAAGLLRGGEELLDGKPGKKVYKLKKKANKRRQKGSGFVTGRKLGQFKTKRRTKKDIFESFK